MSHTDKDRPYWVKLNDDGDATDHDHLHFGRKYYRTRAVRDENGQFVYEDKEIQYSARTIHGREYPLYSYYRATYVDPEVPYYVKKRAMELCSAGRGDELLTVRVERSKVWEQYLIYEVADHCTEGEKLEGKHDAWWGHLPCTPVVTGVSWRKLQTSDKPGLKKAYSRVRYSHERVLARDGLRGAAKLYNCGEDIEDFNDLPLTNQHRHSVAWDLY